MSQEMDKIGMWSEVKLAIVREYMPAYSRLVTDYKLYHLYIDGFAGYGLHESRTSGSIVPGSPLNALNTLPPFREYHFIDLNPARVDKLRTLAPGRHDVHVHGETATRFCSNYCQKRGTRIIVARFAFWTRMASISRGMWLPRQAK
jgi:three-Cys-motif partner protein